MDIFILIFDKIRKFFTDSGDFLKKDIWRMRSKSLPRGKALLINFLRIIILSFRGFKEDKCRLKASALTMYSLLSLVPVVAMIFGIAKGFGLEEMLEKQLVKSIQGQEEVIAYILAFAHSLLENTKGGVIAGIGVVMLFWSVMKVLGNIESSFNDIWNIKRSRSFLRKFSDYLSIILVAPVFIILSSSMTVYISASMSNAASGSGTIEILGPLLIFLMKILPYAIVWLLFSFIYMIMPNTRVKFKAALTAGIIAGTIFQVVQWAYINFQVVLSNYNAIYGSFAALPLLLIWLQLSWIIILFGAEISFATQNVQRYEYESDALGISHSYKRELSLLLVNYIVRRFVAGKEPYTSPQLSKELEIPVRLIRELIFELTESNVLSEVTTTSEKEPAYQPARDVNTMTIQWIIRQMDDKGNDSLTISDSKEKQAIKKALNAFNKSVELLPENVLIKDI